MTRASKTRPRPKVERLTVLVKVERFAAHGFNALAINLQILLEGADNSVLRVKFLPDLVRQFLRCEWARLVGHKYFPPFALIGGGQASGSRFAVKPPLLQSR